MPPDPAQHRQSHCVEILYLCCLSFGTYLSWRALEGAGWGTRGSWPEGDRTFSTAPGEKAFTYTAPGFHMLWKCLWRGVSSPEPKYLTAGLLACRSKLLVLKVPFSVARTCNDLISDHWALFQNLIFLLNDSTLLTLCSTGISDNINCSVQV